jgi:hypothetical protein
MNCITRHSGAQPNAPTEEVRARPRSYLSLAAPVVQSTLRAHAPASMSELPPASTCRRRRCRPAHRDAPWSAVRQPFNRTRMREHIPSGIGSSRSVVANTPSAKPPCPTEAITRSPILKPLTPEPVRTIIPATSLPGEKGKSGLNWYLPWMMSVSGKFTPAAFTPTTKANSGPAVP